MAALFNAPAPLIPPPVYERDPETSSIASAAPSYVSDRPPTYSRRADGGAAEQNSAASGPASAADSQVTLVDSNTSNNENGMQSAPVVEPLPEEPPQRTGLPALRFAPGFSAHTASARVRDLENHSYNIQSWSSIHTSHASRQYHNVAARRYSQAAANTFAGMSPVAPSLSNSSTSSAASSSSSASSRPGNADGNGAPAPEPTPLDPREDPALVGEQAAARARAQRQYREMCMNGRDEALRHESKTWDFMLAQMADWEERGRSWTRFRNEVQMGRGRLGGKILGRKIGGLPGGLRGF